MAISATEECTTDAYGEASKFQLKVPVALVIDALGKIGGEDEGGWFQQRIREIHLHCCLSLWQSLSTEVNQSTV